MNHENTAEDTTSASDDTTELTSTGSRGVPRGAAMFSTASRKRQKIANSRT